MNSVRNPEADVKKKYSHRDSQGHELSEQQQAYFKDSKVRDKDGNLKVMYHGTPNGDYTIFRDGTYFTENKAYADRYQNPGASSISTGKVASRPSTFAVYLDIKKPFDISDTEARRIYIEDYIKGGNAMGINPYLSDAEYAGIKTIDWTEGEDLREFLVDNGYDYDGLVLDEGAEDGYGDEVKSRGVSYAIFSPEQAKNIDNVKPTADPDIRYSQCDRKTEQASRAVDTPANQTLAAQPTKFSDRYWYPNMTKTEITEVRAIAKDEARKTDNYLGIDTKWLYNSKKGRRYFAIYSSIDVESPTVLYARKDERAEFEHQLLASERQREENTRGRINTDAGFVGRLLNGIKDAVGSKGIYSGDTVGTRGNDGDAAIYSRHRGIRPSKAFINCLQNIEKVQQQYGVDEHYLFAVDRGDYAASYDTVVLEVEEIEESPSGSARDNMKHGVDPGPEELLTIKVSELLDLVKGDYEKYIPKFSGRDSAGNQLSERNDIAAEGYTLRQERSGEAVSNRALLANALEGVAQNEIEAGKIREYKEQIGQLNEQEQKLRELNGQISVLKAPMFFLAHFRTARTLFLQKWRLKRNQERLAISMSLLQ